MIQSEESSQLQSTTTRIRRYAATSETEDYDTQSDEDDDLYSADDDDWRRNNEDNASLAALQWLWEHIKNAVRIVANVDNLWDESASGSPTFTATNPNNRRLVVLLWFCILALSYAGERSTFKLLVDRTAPFRLFAVAAVTATHALLVGASMGFSRWLDCRWRKQGGRDNGTFTTTALPLGIPLVDVAIMALLDTVCLLLVFVTGYRVTPTLTVILVQFTLPLTAFLTQFVHPDGGCRVWWSSRAAELDDDDEAENCNNNNAFMLTVHSEEDDDDDDDQEPRVGAAMPGCGGLAQEHIWGSLILFLAVLTALIPAFSSLIDPKLFIYADPIPIRTALNTLLYASSCIPAAAVTLYKEHVFLQYKQPVNMNYLNLLLSIFQFILASLLSPLLFVLQGLGAPDDWTSQYPSAQFGENYSDGLRCILRGNDNDKYPEYASCRYAWLLVVVHAASIVMVGVAVDKIVHAGATKVMYRGVSAGIIVSVLLMHNYDMHIPDFNYGPAIDGLNLFCLVLLILGSEVYHRVTLPDSTFETEYAPIENIYDDG